MPLDVDKGIELPQLELISTKNDDCTTEYSTGKKPIAIIEIINILVGIASQTFNGVQKYKIFVKTIFENSFYRIKSSAGHEKYCLIKKRYF